MVDKFSQTLKGLGKRLKDVFGLKSSQSAKAAELRAKYTHFRVLVIGRANAGKTTILKRVCNTTEDPVYDELQPTHERGIHNVRHTFSFKSNPEFIFHDSPGFEAGGEEELLEVQAFIQEKAKSRGVHDQLHVIWFCFTPNASRPLLDLEKRFFNEQRAGNVPVVAIFTKFDDLIVQVYDDGKDKEANRVLACATLEEKFEKPLKGYAFPPCAYVRFESIHKNEGNHQEQVGELIRQTAASINNLALKIFFITVQQNNLEICIEFAVKRLEFQRMVEMDTLLEEAASWFKHSYETCDYGASELEERPEEEEDGDPDPRELFRALLDRPRRPKRFRLLAPLFLLRRRRFDDLLKSLLLEERRLNAFRTFLAKIKSIVFVKYEKPSLSALAAILICLEHSFWHVQSGSTAATAFQRAWALYLGTQQSNVDANLEQHFKQKGADDLFQPYDLSKAERDTFITIVLDNRLSPHPST